MHATVEELELFVAARLTDVDATRVSRHCDGCDDCARALTREARLELSLHGLAAGQRCGTRADGAERLEVARRPAPPTRLYALAAAACVLLAFAAARLPRLAVDAAPHVMVADAGDFVRASDPAPVWADSELSGGTK